MTDSPHRPGSGWGEPNPPNYPRYGDSGYADPAYANQAPAGVPYQPPTGPAPTRQLPAFPQWDTGYVPYGTGDPNDQRGVPGGPSGPPPPGSPRRWLWVLAAVSVLIVVGLVAALVIVSSSGQQTVVAPAPSLGPSTTNTTTPRTTTRRPTPTLAPTSPALPLPLPGQTTPSVPAVPGQTEAVGYEVGGSGRAMSITYVDSGGVLQTEFNVLLPWNRQVELAKPARSSASVTIINFGREITCSVSVSGRVVENRTGSGLTICAPTG